MVIVFDKPKRAFGMWMCGYTRHNGRLVPVLTHVVNEAHRMIYEHRHDNT